MALGLPQALRNLERLGAGPWPYWASLIYFLGGPGREDGESEGIVSW